MEQQEEFSKEEIDGLLARLKAATQTRQQKIGKEKEKKTLTDLQRIRLEVARAHCPHLVPQILAEIEGGAKIIQAVQAEEVSQAHLRPLTAQEIVALVCNSFAAKFGTEFRKLPAFQIETFKAMTMRHLGYIPAEKGQLDEAKGVYLCGESQIGKTSVFTHLKESGFFKFRIVTSYRLAREAQKSFKETFDSYGKGYHLFIDEVGMESTINNFSAKHDIVAEIIHERFDKGLVTHFTSNFLVDDLPYDHHIKMRVRQGCNIIIAKDAKPFMQ